MLQHSPRVVVIPNSYAESGREKGTTMRMESPRTWPGRSRICALHLASSN